MATKAQTEANRENAKKSTGPRTAEGKRIVSQNAVKHGLFADGAVINGEDQAQFDLFREELISQMAPFGAMESFLAERIVSLAWRLRRADRMQNQTIDELIERLTPSPLDFYVGRRTPAFLRTKDQEIRDVEPKDALGQMAYKDWSHSRILDRMVLYERRIESSMMRTMNKLKQVQIMARIEKEGAAEQQSAQQNRSPATREARVKKQTQFAPSLMDASRFVEKDYRNRTRPESAENKPNQTQSQTQRRPSRRGKGEIATALRASQ